MEKIFRTRHWGGGWTEAEFPSSFQAYHCPSTLMCFINPEAFQLNCFGLLWRLHSAGMIDEIIGHWRLTWSPAPLPFLEVGDGAEMPKSLISAWSFCQPASTWSYVGAHQELPHENTTHLSLLSQETPRVWGAPVPGIRATDQYPSMIWRSNVFSEQMPGKWHPLDCDL